MQSLTTAQQQKNGAAEAKPPRPYTEYNIFFQLEKEHMLQRGASASTRATEANMLYNGIEMPPRYRNLVLPSEWHVSGKKKTKRKHRKTHGMVSFTDLTKIISNRWKAVDPETKSYCKQMAAIELARYKEVMETYTAKYGKPVRVYKKRKQASPASTKKPEQGRSPSPVKSSSTPTACTRDAPAVLNMMTCAPCGGNVVESNAALSAEMSHGYNLPSHPYEAQHKRQRMTPSSTAVQPLHASSSSQHDIISQPHQHFFPGDDPNYEIKLEEDIDLFLDSFAKEERDLQAAGEGSSSSAPTAFDGSQLHPEDLHDDEMLDLFSAIADHAPSAPAAAASSSQCPHERLNLRELELQKREEELRQREQQLQQQFNAAAFHQQARPEQPMSAVDRFWMDAPGLSA